MTRLDLVYPLKRNASHVGDMEMRYSLRSIKANLHLPGYEIDSVVVFGSPAPWLAGSEGHGLRVVPMDDPGDKALNLIAKYRRMVEDDEVSDPFLLLDDDHVFLKPTTAIALHTKGMLATLCQEYRGNTHGRYLQNCHDLLTKAGLPTRNYQIHYPLFIHKAILRRTLALIDRPTVMGSLYGNMVEGETVEVSRDFKLNKVTDFEALRHGHFVSLADGQMRMAQVRKWLSVQLPAVTGWESTPRIVPSRRPVRDRPRRIVPCARCGGSGREPMTAPAAPLLAEAVG